MCGRAVGIPFPVPAAQCISYPPSTLKAAPVMFSARSEARKAAISPMSFGVWKRVVARPPSKDGSEIESTEQRLLDLRQKRGPPLIDSHALVTPPGLGLRG
jgi:hypothetical protein